MLQNEELFNKYFHTFYSNHTKLYHWYLLAREKHHEIKMYLNKKLLAKTVDNYKSEMKAIQQQYIRDK